MRSERKLRLRTVVSSRSDASRHLSLPGDAVLINRGLPRLLLLMCPCGCGEQLPINLDSRAGPAWRLYQSHNNAFTLYPSVWRESGCESHFIIWRNEIYLFCRDEEEWDDVSGDDSSMPDSHQVLSQLPALGLISFAKVADALNADPWDVLRVCRKLVRSGLARQGLGDERSSFGRVTLR